MMQVLMPLYQFKQTLRHKSMENKCNRILSQKTDINFR